MTDCSASAAGIEAAVGVDWTAKLRHFLQVLAFCLAVGAIQYGFQPDRPYAPTVVYSLFIGTIIWAVIDLGRHLFPSAAETGWPQGVAGVALVVGGIAAGYLLGTRAAGALCEYYGWFPADPVSTDASHWRANVLVTVLAGIAGSFYFYSANKSAYLLRKMREAHSHATEAQLKLLQSQLEPHMLFNTLANLRVLIGTDPQRAQQMLDHMIAYLRATLNASRESTHTLQAEFDRLRDYLELMAVRMGPRLAYTLDLPPALAQQQVPTLLLQPLVENSIQHGLEPKVEGGRISVSARREGDSLVLQVADTGVGTAHALASGLSQSKGPVLSQSKGPVLSQSKGFGLTQVRERLATLYGTAAALDFTADPGRGACTTARLPVAT